MPAPLIPIIQGLAGMVYLFTAESGILITTINRSVERTWQFVYDASIGYDVGFVADNPQATYAVTGRKTAATGLAAAAPATALTMANLTTGNGVDVGTVWTQTVALQHSEKQFQELNIGAIQKPGIT